MFCQKCGANLGEVPGDTCPYCGNPVEAASEKWQSGGGDTQPAQPQSQSGGGDTQPAQPQSQSGETTILTGQPYNQQAPQNGYQQNGYQQNGYQQNGYQQNGYQQNGYQQNGYQQNGYRQNGYQQNVRPNQGGQNPYQYHANPGNQGAGSNTMPMGWYKFIIYVQLFVIAGVSLINAGLSFTGLSLGSWDEVRLLYAFIPELQMVMIVTGAITLGIAVFAIVVRQWLAHYEQKGIIGLYVLRGLIIANNVFGTMAMTAIIHTTVSSSVVSSCIVSIVLLVIDLLYFGKRKQLFH